MYINSNQLENELKSKGFKDLGWANGWGRVTPEIVDACRNAKHIRKDEQHNPRGSDNTVYCEICKYYYKYDCSD